MVNPSIEDFFNSIARQYNDERVIKGGRLFNEFIEIPATKSLVEKVSNRTKILDIGCGVGAYSAFFALRGAQVLGIDLSEKMLEIAQENCKEYGKVRFQKTSFEEFRANHDERFDIIVGGFMLSYFEDLNLIFRKIRKLLRSNNSYAILSMLHPVRLSATEKGSDGFVVQNYFDENDYHTDLGVETDSIALKKWNFEDIVSAARSQRLFLDAVLEPVPSQVNYKHIDKKQVTFYHKCPSVIVFKFKKQ